MTPQPREDKQVRLQAIVNSLVSAYHNIRQAGTHIVAVLPYAAASIRLQGIADDLDSLDKRLREIYNEVATEDRDYDPSR
jgi:hypothetical protein